MDGHALWNGRRLSSAPGRRSPLPEVAQPFPADLLRTRLRAGHDPLGRRQAGDSHPAPHFRNVRAPDVHSFARPAHATDPRDHGGLTIMAAEVQALDRMGAFLERLHALEGTVL